MVDITIVHGCITGRHPVGVGGSSTSSAGKWIAFFAPDSVTSRSSSAYQECFQSYLKKMLQRDVRTLQIHLACYLKKLFHISGMSSRSLQEDVTTYRERLASDVTKIFRTYQEHLASYLAKLLHRIRNVLHVA